MHPFNLYKKYDFQFNFQKTTKYKAVKF